MLPYERQQLIKSRQGSPQKIFKALKEELYYNKAFAKEIASLKNVSREEYFETDYWDIIRKYVLAKSGYYCDQCGRDKLKLSVCHKEIDYLSDDLSYQGEDHKNLDSLTALCDDCHKQLRIKDKYKANKTITLDMEQREQ